MKLSFAVIDLSALPYRTDPPGPYFEMPRAAARYRVMGQATTGGRFVFDIGLHCLLVVGQEP